MNTLQPFYNIIAGIQSKNKKKRKKKKAKTKKNKKKKNSVVAKQKCIDYTEKWP